MHVTQFSQVHVDSSSCSLIACVENLYSPYSNCTIALIKLLLRCSVGRMPKNSLIILIKSMNPIKKPKKPYTPSKSPQKRNLHKQTLSKQIPFPYKSPQKAFDFTMPDLEEDLHINPLPTPAFVHFDANNTETPLYKYTPILTQRIRQRIQTNHYINGN